MHRRLALRAVGGAALAALLAPIGGCAVTAPARRWQSELLREHPLTGTIWDFTAQRFVAPENLAAALRAAHYRLLGEVHDNPDHHAIQAELLDAIGAGGIKPVVAFEQFDRKYDAELQQRQTAGMLTADDVADVVKFDRRGWNWEFYRPLVDVALRYSMPLRAANLSRTTAGQFAKQGFAALAPGRVAALQMETAWSAGKEQALRDIIVEGHCRALPESMVPAMTAAQRARDATLAEVLLEAGRDGAVLITGNGHARRDLGVPAYLNAGATGKTVCAVGILEVAAGVDEPRAYAESPVMDIPRFDFAYFTPCRERPDPCAAFKRG